MKPVVFIGPTISEADAARELDADFRPPVQLGDVWRAGLEGPPAIGIVDGYFDRVPAVWHKEILWALSEGIPVYGSASMGALRAAEMRRFGMIGVGAIFESYAAGELEDDDEVAMAHTDAASGYRALSEPMVNIRSTLASAEGQGVISPASRSAFEAAAKSLFYTERIWPAVFRRAGEAGVPVAEWESLRAWFARNRVDQKRVDAVAMLRVMREPLSTPLPTVVMEETTLWRELTLTEGPDGAEARAVLEELYLDGPLHTELSRAAEERWQRHSQMHAVLDEARGTNAYSKLASRARRKAAFLASPSGDNEAALHPDALLTWFFETRLGGWPDDLTAYLLERGWTDEAYLLDLALKEYRFWRAGET